MATTPEEAEAHDDEEDEYKRRMERKKKKEERRRKKKQLIEDSGGVRPRKAPKTNNTHEEDNKKASKQDAAGASRHNNHNNNSRNRQHQHQHRFGKVMDTTPSRQQPRLATVSIAVPGSIVANCQTKELRTQLVGQIARAATIYHVDEIVVFDDKLSSTIKQQQDSSNRGGFQGRFSKQHYRQQQREWKHKKDDDSNNNDNPRKEEEQDSPQQQQQPRHASFDPHAFFARVLQYCETPQYLRRHFFPMHPDLQFVGLLAPTDAPHHVRADDCCKYREGVVLNKTAKGGNGGSLVHCGVPNRPVELVGDTTRLQPGIRCTVQMDPFSYKTNMTTKQGKHNSNKHLPPLKGHVVSPSAPRHDDGTYWGYTTRTADSLKAALDQCPWDGGAYDLKIGTSERGTIDLDGDDDDSNNNNHGNTNPSSSLALLPPYRHAMIVFGGVAGIEECVDADESLRLPGSESHKLFDLWINVCKYQGSRTIRTEEAVLISLARLSPLLRAAECNTAADEKEEDNTKEATGGPEAKESVAATTKTKELDPNDLARFDDDNSMSEESSEEEE